MTIFIPIIIFFIQMIFTFAFVFFLGYFPWIWIFQVFWINFTNLVLPIIVIGGISLSFLVKNPVWALLGILSSFLMLGILLINVGIEFITYFFIIVYLGALMMLFLFVIMLFDLQALTSTNQTKNYKIINSFKLFIMYIFVYNLSIIIIQNLQFLNLSCFFWTLNQENIDFNVIFFLNMYMLNPILIFKTIYTTNKIYFIIITLILLYALVGALIVISMLKKKK